MQVCANGSHIDSLTDAMADLSDLMLDVMTYRLIKRVTTLKLRFTPASCRTAVNAVDDLCLAILHTVHQLHKLGLSVMQAQELAHLMSQKCLLWIGAFPALFCMSIDHL